MVKYEIVLVLLALCISSVLCKPSGDLLKAENAMAPSPADADMSPSPADAAAPSGSQDYYYYDYGCDNYDYEYVEDMGSGPSVAVMP